ncbi:hypothetical protein [Pseudorhodoferax sp. Leaf274]|uniref:hypothetical protein n=1 Tax=Pseudorhodoferax sp. Leaf274 TaxID=1736318 RepID=UPI0009E8450B|nr:hypothetical protein [Pseudorhodoferax sp. Leaf274]
MTAARTTLGLWLLLQLLLGGLQGGDAPALHVEASAAHWHGDTARRDRADALAQRQHAPRTASLSADDMLAGGRAPTLLPAGPQPRPCIATPGRAGAPVLAGYRARAPPSRA